MCVVVNDAERLERERSVVHKENFKCLKCLEKALRAGKVLS
jgi:hypothetical protein